MNMQTTHAHSRRNPTTGRRTPEYHKPKRGRWGNERPVTGPETSLHSLPRPTAAPKLTAAEFLMDFEEASGEQRF
jgi:hypothetical protein